MILERVYVKPINSLIFRHPSGKYGEIVGTFNIKPNDALPFRLCFMLQWKDGLVDYLPFECVTDGDCKIVRYDKELKLRRI